LLAAELITFGGAGRLFTYCVAGRTLLASLLALVDPAGFNF